MFSFSVLLEVPKNLTYNVNIGINITPTCPISISRFPKILREPGGISMAMRKVLAHYMHEEELAAAQQAMPGGTTTESYVFGDIEEQDIQKLRDRGLIVQDVGPAEASKGTGGGGDLSRGAAGLDFSVEAAAPAFDAGASPASPGYNRIELAGPLLEDWRSQLEQANVQLLEQVSPNVYTARLDADQITALEAMPFVTAVQSAGPKPLFRAFAAAGVPPSFAPPPPPSAPPAEPEMKVYDIRLYRPEDLQAVQTSLTGLVDSIVGSSSRKIRVKMLPDEIALDDIRFIDGVADVSEYVPPKLHNDLARRLLGIDAVLNHHLAEVLTETGDGQLVAIADTGLDVNHPDFQGRIQTVIARGRPNDPSDPHGHGTHVTGSVLGDGAASGGKIRGSAPKAKLIFQSLLDSQGSLGGLPLDLGDLFQEAYDAGARIHNNSWGSATRSQYTVNSIEVDDFVAKHRDMLIIISAGNDGVAVNVLNSKTGYVDWLSINSPASCKNGLTVGASRSSRRKGGLSDKTYQMAWPAKFPDLPIAGQKISGNPEALAAFSSRGPCEDERIKPDLVAPGTNIASTRSSLAPELNYWGLYPGNDRYAFMGGTSMSAPLVTGCAALVREHYVSKRNHQPSAALLKATLLNGTRKLTARDAIADHNGLPNYHQGFGMVHMPWTLPNPTVPAMKLEFVDGWQDPTLQFTRTGQRLRFLLHVDGGDWLRITMAYTDLPANHLQNNLNLFLEYQPTRQKWFGNLDLPRGLNIPDPTNNIEVIRLDKPAPGDYIIYVSAVNLLESPQDFALVVTGNLSAPLQKL